MGSNPPVDVYPCNDDAITFTHERGDEKVFYERKLKNKLKFINDPKDGISDFVFFKSYEDNPATRCETFRINIFKKCGKNSPYILDWSGKFGLNDCEWDLDRCIMTVKPAPDTIYSCIKSNRRQEVNILDVPQIISTSVDLTFNYEFHYCVGVPSVLCPKPGVQTATWATFQQGNYAYTKGCANFTVAMCLYYRETVITACVGGTPNPPPGSGWALETNNCATTATCKYVRFPGAGNFPYLGQFGMGWYNWFTNQEELPPFPQNKNITVTATPASMNLELGYTTLAQTTAGATSIAYNVQVPNNANSTYVWSLNPGSPVTAIVSGTTNVGTIQPNSLTLGVIQVLLTETHGNGHVSTKVFSFTQVNAQGLLNPNVTIGCTINGPQTVCKNQTGLIFTASDIPATTGLTFTGPIWSVSSGTATITAGAGTNEITVTAGTANFSLQYQWTALYVGTGTTTYQINCIQTINVAVADIPVTPDFTAPIDQRYPNEPSELTLLARTGALYTWYRNELTSLGSGTTAGGYNTLSFNAPAVVGSYCYVVKETVDCGCSNWIRLIPSQANGTVGFTPPFYWCIGASLSPTITYTRNRSFKEVCEYVVDEIGCGITGVVSDFFGWNPPGDSPGYTPGNNYVLSNQGISPATNKLTNLTIAQKSDIISYLSSNAATKGLITFDKLEKIWATMFNAYWFIDSLDRLRIEHISYFNRTTPWNAHDSTHGKFNIAKNKYSYDKSKMPKFEVFRCSEMMFTDFIGTAIYYDSICVDQDGESNSKENFLDFVTTDLYSLFLDPSSANKIGFVLMCNAVSGGTYIVDSEVGQISTNIVANGHLSWANLHYNYHKYNRVLKTGFLNNVLTTFYTVKPTKEQKDMVLKVCCGDDFDPLLQMVRTNLGDGIVAEADEDTEKGIIKMTLLHS